MYFRFTGTEMSDDDGYDFPPTRYPAREAFTLGLVLILVVMALVFGALHLLRG